MYFDDVLLQFLLPLIIEKLDSDVQSAKLDSLQTLVKTKQKQILVHLYNVDNVFLKFH